MAVAVTLFAAAMWGSWMQIIRRCPDYPVYGTTLVLYAAAFAALCIACAACAGRLFPQGLAAYVRAHRQQILQIAFGGGAAALGVITSLSLMRNAGLAVGTAVSGAAGSITGVLVAVAREGLPRIAHAPLALAACTVVTVAAGVLCSMASGVRKEKNRAGAENILLLCAFVVLSNGYIYGTSAGTSAGMHPLAVCTFLCFGAFVAAGVLGGIVITAKREWKTVLCVGASKKPLVYAAAAAVCHYGGNFLSILCMPVLSATLSFLIGRSANLWTIFFGIAMGEFRGAGKRPRLLLAAGIALYAAGVLMIAFFFY